jgi:hypothetical protein
MSRYRPGDWVIPTDLPHTHVCRVLRAERLPARAGGGQILTLLPLGGPWPPATELVRLDHGVRAADARDLWQSYTAPSRPVDVRRRLVLAQSAA